ncbi:xanthine dehydrogenase family protein subunit M [Micromonospora sp. U21]|uniref:FAD binding domain-containing protein n=1 Tax=Micromonospora sp. U21 TaxID=2824899 RepID=UPI001B396CFA|nr:FAD binding domain-containing protein [Micromonospora sp. U21]MBQ0904997.1 FAD binding domain-containing protein [Micromonospora sp. U21]
MKPPLHQPTSVAEACELLDTLEETMVYGGGTAIQILIKQGVLFAGNLVDLSRVPGLAEIEETAEGLRVGPMTTLRRMETSEVVRRRVPLAAQTYGHVANPRVRNTASVGGNIAHGDYRLDPPTALLVLGARVELTSVRGTRAVPIRDFFVDFQVTAVEPGELITALHIPAAPAGNSSTFVKMSSLGENDWPAASVAAQVDVERRTLRLGLGALAHVPRYVEVPLDGRGVDAAVAAATAAVEPELDPIPDVRGSADYKRKLGLVATEDAVRRAWEEAR